MKRRIPTSKSSSARVADKMILAPELVVKIPVKKVKKEKPFFFQIQHKFIRYTELKDLCKCTTPIFIY